jgi:hypothetical protein
MWRKAWLLSVLLAVSCSAFAVPDTCGPVQTFVDRQRAYPSVIAAVDAMRREHLDHSIRSDREFVGAVVEDGAGGYWTSVGKGCSGQNTVTFVVHVPATMQLAAFWHTHGSAAPLRELFSPDDVDLVRSTGRDFYLITPRGEIRVLRPNEVQRMRVIGSGRATASRAAIGRAVKPNLAVIERV